MGGNVAEFRKPDRTVGAPHDLTAEQGLLGAVLYANNLMDEISDELGPEAFYEPTHGKIFETARNLINSGRRADAVTVNHVLGSALDDIGGFDYLTDLVEISTTAGACIDYAKLIRELWQRRELIKIGESISAQARGGETAAVLIEHSERELLGLQINSRQLLLASAATTVASVENQLDNPRIAFGTKLGLDPIDDVTGGFMPGECWLLAGRPGSGKSAIASTGSLNVSQAVCSATGEPTGAIEICSEMTNEQMMRRHIADMGYRLAGPEAPSYSAIRKRMLTHRQREIFNEAVHVLRQLKTLKSLYRTGLTISNLRTIVRRQMSMWAREGIKVGLVTVDHVGLLRAATSSRGRTEAQGEIARELKEMAGDLDIPLLALVQLNRQVEARDDKRPMLSDLRDSGEFEENADGVIGVYREAYYALREPEPKRHDLKLLWDERRTSRAVDAMFLKIREGQMQTVKLWADMGRNAIRGAAPENYYRTTPLIDMLDPDAPLPARDDPSVFQ